MSIIKSEVDLMQSIRDGELLFHLHNSGHFINLPTNTGWDIANTGTGTSFTGPAYLFTNTGIGVSSTSRLFCAPMGLDTNYAKVNFDKKLLIHFNLARTNSDAQLVGRIQFKTVVTEGILSGIGLGLQVSNYTIIGETYGAARGTTDTLYTLSDAEMVKVTIAHYPGEKVEFYINDILKAVYSTTANIPSGSVTSIWVNSLINGLTGGVSAYMMLSQIQLWQEK